MLNQNQNYQAKIVCGQCKNETFNLSISVFQGTRDLIATCTCGRTMRYYAEAKFLISSDNSAEELAKYPVGTIFDKSNVTLPKLRKCDECEQEVDGVTEENPLCKKCEEAERRCYVAEEEQRETMDWDYGE